MVKTPFCIWKKVLIVRVLYNLILYCLLSYLNDGLDSSRFNVIFLYCIKQTSIVSNILPLVISERVLIPAILGQQFSFYNKYCLLFLYTETRWWHLSVDAQVENSPSPRHCHSAIVHESSMWVYGGLNNLQPLRDLWKWSFGKWWSTWLSHYLQRHFEQKLHVS